MGIDIIERPETAPYTEQISQRRMTATTKLIRSSNWEFVKFIEDKNTKWLSATKENRDRYYEAIGAFYDIAGGMWPTSERTDLINQGRHPVSINIAQQKLQALAGSMFSEKWDFNWTPLDLNENTLTRGIKHLYYADKDDYNYDYENRLALEEGLMHASYTVMDIDYRTRRTGGISFRKGLPGMILEDPYWQTNDVMDWKEAIEHAWMTAEEIIQHFETDDSFIQQAAQQDAIGGFYYEPVGDVRVLEQAPDRWGSKYQVIQYRWMEDIRTSRLHISLPNGEWIALPGDIGEDEVREAIAINGVTWEDVFEFPYEDSILNIGTVCPELSPTGILYKGPHDVQCGMIGIFPFASFRSMGVNKGVFENLLDINRTLNYRESKKDDILASMVGGGLAVNVDGLPNGKRDFEKLKQNATRPDYILAVNDDPNKVVAPLRGNNNQNLNAIWQDMSHLIDMFDRVTPVTPALEGMSGGSEESGILFEMRHAVTKLSTVMLVENWKQHLIDMANAWYRQAAITHRGVYRKVSTETGIIEFNSPVYDESGTKYYLNNVEDLPNARIIVTLAKSSPTERFSRQMEIFNITKVLSAHPDLFKNQIRILTNDLLMTFDREPSERIKIESMARLEEIRDIVEVMTQIKALQSQGMQADVMMAQAKQMLAQLTAPAQAAGGMAGQPAGAGGGGGGGVPAALSPANPTGRGGGMSPAETPPTIPTNAGPGAAIQTRRGEFQP